ncbi:cytochrome P450 [Streptomyces sp. NPDC002466]|uniref:cytochrome P450 n=1 Tax=unclassified Streptomyces TaxID=2593676 RepID=UPI0021CC7696|nr:cytochrome P450 [Streptomyces sp. sk2.1]
MSVSDVHGAGPAVEQLQPLHCLPFAGIGPPRRTSVPNGTEVWLVTRYGDVRQVLMDAHLQRSLLSSPDAPALTDTPNLLDAPGGMINLDGAEHLRLRRVVRQVFTPRGVKRLRPWVERAIDRLLDELEERGSSADLMAGYALAVPNAVMRRLMGVQDLEDDRLRRWAEHAVSDTSRSAQEVAAGLRDLMEFSADLLAERRAAPGEDLVSTLARAADR